jgi:hypothetical protein
MSSLHRRKLRVRRALELRGRDGTGCMGWPGTGRCAVLCRSATISHRYCRLRGSPPAAARNQRSKRPATIINNGHTIQLDFGKGNSLNVSGRTYALKQFHFHHPSEHLVAGRRFAMEAHFVHEGADGLAVVGVLMVAGNRNAVFEKIVATMPQEASPAVAADPAIDPRRLLPLQRAISATKAH